MDKKKSLLERYGIPVNHLDFKYIANCNDAKEMEQMVHILRTGEEGYYPDLTKCAEDKLRELKPQSRLFRLEEQIKGREALDSHEWKPIYDWNLEIKDKDHQLVKLKGDENSLDSQLPPIRKIGRILQEKKNETATETLPNGADQKKLAKTPVTTDYRKWDLYDADAATLSMDLAEERAQEEVERKNRLNARKCKSPPKIEELCMDDKKANDKAHVLTDIEKEKLSDEYRLRGNEYFRAKELDNALVEYSKAIQIYPEKAVAPYNNRAVTYIKQQKFAEAIRDCVNCLQLDPKNLKGRLRLAESSYAYGRRRESYQLYVNVLEVDPENAVAHKAITELRKMFPALPPPNATRIKISDAASLSTVKTDKRDSITSSTKREHRKSETNAATAAAASKTTKHSEPSDLSYDLADLVKPSRVVKNKLLMAAENFGKMQTKMNEANTERTKTKPQQRSVERSDGVADVLSDLRMPCLVGEGTASSSKKKPLIEEI